MFLSSIVNERERCKVQSVAEVEFPEITPDRLEPLLNLVIEVLVQERIRELEETT